MAYASYDYYTQDFFGKAITSTDEFSRLAERASEYIDFVTFGRAAVYTATNDLLKKACCAVAEAMKINEEGGGVVAETVGKITRNYAAGVSTAPTEEQRLYRAVSRYLSRTGLLYLGVNP
jgi:hypothetical protein